MFIAIEFIERHDFIRKSILVVGSLRTTLRVDGVFVLLATRNLVGIGESLGGRAMAEPNLIRGLHDRAQARAAGLVDGVRRHLVSQTALHRDLTRGVRSDARLPRVLPKITSSMAFGSMPLRSIVALALAAPRCGAVIDASAPLGCSGAQQLRNRATKQPFHSKHQLHPTNLAWRCTHGRRAHRESSPARRARACRGC